MPHSGFDRWIDSPQGRYILAWESRQIDELVVDIFGYNAVQLGFFGHDFLRTNRMPLRIHAGADGDNAVRCDLRHLPFASSSVDLIVLPHTLEFCPDPHQILREIERVLMPEGRVIITGFNPFSLWGLARRTTCDHEAFPWSGRYLSPLRLRDWLALLDFETASGTYGCYAPPFRSEQWLARSRMLELAGNRWWPIAGSVYLVEAIKRLHGMRLITPAWRDKLAQRRALAPAARLQRNEADGITHRGPHAR